ncbi:MAG: hypothetical protein FWG68_07410 [Defluviitaleaceae bacterium]|nr:hypothetical protein [Defluviitaleaceae bacterium]
MKLEYLPMNAAALMDRVFDLYKATFKIQIAFSVILGIISFVLLFGVITIFAVTLASAMIGMGDVDDNTIFVIVIVFGAVILPLIVAWTYFSSSGHILIAKQAFYKEIPQLPFAATFQALGRVITVALAHLILSLPWLIILGLLIYSFTTGFDVLFFITEEPLLFFLFTLIYAVVYVIYSNIFALSVPVAIFDKRLFFASVKESWRLIKGDFWRILGIRLLWLVLVQLLSFSAQGLFSTIILLVTAFAESAVDISGIWVMVVAGQLPFWISTIITLLVAPMEGIMTATIYFNQKIKKDALDISIGLELLSRRA